MNKVYHLKSEKIKQEITLFLATDLHYDNKEDLKRYQWIKEELKRDKPKLLLLGGDILDSAMVKDENLLLEEIKSWTKEVMVIIVLGNHDMTIKKGKKNIYYENHSFWEKAKKIKNVVLLENGCYEEENFRIIGVTLPYDYYYKKKNMDKFFKKELKKYDHNKMNLLLIHSASPFYTEKGTVLLRNIDVVLSGHNHNGMVPKIIEKVMKHRGIVSPARKWFPKYVRGSFRRYHTTFIISGGMTKLSKRSGLSRFNRFWNSELTKIIIEKE